MLRSQFWRMTLRSLSSPQISRATASQEISLPIVTSSLTIRASRPESTAGGRPGVSPTRIVPWVGKVQLRADTVGFREWPESQITVADYIPCNSLLTTMDSQEANVAAALQAAAR